MKYWKVKYGYGIDDFVVVDETEISKALRAQINGSVAIFKEGSVSGRSIITITPDLNKLLGLNRTYQLTAEDYWRIPEKALNEYKDFLDNIILQITGKKETEPQILPPSNFSKELSEKMKLK